MSRNPRPNREEVRTAILQTAQDIAAVNGWSAVTVRKVAERIGYTAPIIYEHFGSKREMLIQVLKEGYGQLYDAVVNAAEEHEDSEDRLTAMAMAYWDFAHERPEIYQLMYGMERAYDMDKEAQEYAAPLVQFVNGEFRRFIPERATPEKIHTLVVEGWSMIHGLASLDISGYVARYADGRTVLESLIPDTLYALKRGRK